MKGISAEEFKEFKLMRHRVGLIVLSLVLIGLFAFGAGIHFYYQGKTLPNLRFLDTGIGGLSKEEALAAIDARYAEINQTAIPVRVEDQTGKTVETKTILASAFALDLGDSAELANKVRIYGQLDLNFFNLLNSVFDRKYIGLKLNPDRQKIEQVLGEQLESITQKIDAHYLYDAEQNKFSVITESIGHEPDYGQFTEGLKKYLAKRSETPMEIKLDTQLPTVKAADLAEHTEAFAELVRDKVITIKSGANLETKIDLTTNSELIGFDHYSAEELITIRLRFPLKLTFANDRFADYIATEINPKIKRAAGNVSLSLSQDNSRAEVIGEGLTGQEIDYPKLVQAMDEAIWSETESTVELPIKIIDPALTITPELQAMGVTGLVGSGYTSYFGSPANRKHNIQVGLKRFNGLLIQPEATFSFNEYLGTVDASTGYLPELVIKPEGTIPEYGGGLCQVSTTLYRAVLNTDLPVLERRNHSYAVPYYAQQMGHGLDATIYPGSVDLKFKNTTKGVMVLQTVYRDGEAFFNIYGTPKETKIRFEGPFISNYSSIAEPLEVVDPKLPAGTRKQVEKAHTGFDVVWHKYTTLADGTEQKDTIVSKYKATPNKFLIGPGVEPSTPEVVNSALVNDQGEFVN
jgi:vancomycin resistance protein YoaR